MGRPLYVPPGFATSRILFQDYIQLFWKSAPSSVAVKTVNERFLLLFLHEFKVKQNMVKEFWDRYSFILKEDG